MHGVETLADLGRKMDAYRDNFVLSLRNNHPVKPDAHPIKRVVSGESFDQVVVEVERRDNSSER